ncbi:MAG: sulfur carrier protein ThiS [Deltaproteobacteria bacterium]|nr:sulfur carrier protein ThiS [Deltaproteobacteria bacterium]
MIVRLNGQEREVADGMTVTGLLEAFNIRREGIAVDINREVVPKRLHKETLIRDGDSIEIIRMAGGG